jgi:hypothetical protein
VKDIPQDTSGGLETQLRTSEMPSLYQMQKSCIRFNNSKLNVLQKFDIEQHYIIIHMVAQYLSHHNLKIRTITIFKNLVKENNGSHKTCRYVHDFIVPNLIYLSTTLYEVFP